jgi:hypothetical protein
MDEDREQIKQLCLLQCKQHVVMLLQHIERLDNPISTKQWLRSLVENGIPKETK